ncbi:MAG: site-specific integrase [Ignavibacteriales bacterium]|nr:site-specific integrase [Ignavibacteriales bacterium]
MAGEIRFVKSYSRKTTALTQEEISILFNTISKSTDSNAERDKTLFAVYAYTGIRKSEALELLISDYDSVSKIFHLRKSKRSSKTFQIIPTILSQILDKYLEERLKLINRDNDSLPLFPGKELNKKLSSRQASNRFEKWKRISGIRKNLTIHSFRAAYASQLYKKTKDPLLVSYALGHSSFETTKRYICYDHLNFCSIINDAFISGV